MSPLSADKVRQSNFVSNQHFLVSKARRRVGLGLGACAIALAACGGGADSVSSGNAAAPDAAESGAVSEAEAAAAANLPLLQPADQVVDFEVLDVADGSISSLRAQVTGDRPVLLWFFSPH